MKKRLTGLFLTAIVLTFSTASFGQGSTARRVRRPASPNVEFTFDAPRGWKRTEAEGGYNLVSPAESIVIFVRPHSKDNAADAIRSTEIDSTYRVVSKLQTLKNGAQTFRVSKQTAGGTGVVDVFVLMSPSGTGGVLVLALSGPANSDAAFSVAESITNSISFGSSRLPDIAAVPQPAAPVGSGGSEWEARIAGKHLLFMFSGNGYFEEKHIYLCSSGTFVQTTGSGGYTPGNSDGGSFGARGGRRGRWGVSGSTLVLQFQDGAAVQYNITQRQARNEVGLNGKRFFIDGNAGC